MKCINCKKELEAGEFVVLNCGALVKTETGAMMGDDKLLGFMSVSNHFDSKSNYRSINFDFHESNGQIEVYACSHKCLIEVLTEKISKLKQD
jgi:hypothetical protein